jgi:rRNA maturation endonuclease Nob1
MSYYSQDPSEPFRDVLVECRGCGEVFMGIRAGERGGCPYCGSQNIYVVVNKNGENVNNDIRESQN